MEEMSTKLTRMLIFFVIGVFIIRNAIHAGFFEEKDHKGKGYYVVVPQGWKKVKKRKDVVYPQGVEVVLFVPKGTDVKKEEPDIFISIFTKKLDSPMWIEDEMPDIRHSIRRAGHQIMDKGQIKLSGKVSEWMVYHDQKKPALVLEFYMVTESGVFYKMQYSAHPEDFNVYRKSFEELKESFKFRFSLF